MRVCMSVRCLIHAHTSRKWNVLRKRVDSAQYDVDQLLLGTLGFVVACFLMPTISVYYLFLGITHLILSLWCVSCRFNLRLLN